MLYLIHNMQTPKISILIPIFNVEKYLEECLDSVVGQSLKDIEIICINDGSTDKSLSIIKRYASQDPRIVTVNKKNSGYGDSMNRGLAKARGEYIGIVESDDFIENDMFEKLYNLAVRHDAEVVKSNFFYYYTDLTSTSPQWDEKIGAVYNKERRSAVTQHNTLCKLVNSNEVGRVVNPMEERTIFYQRPAIWSAIYKRSFLNDNDIRFLPTPGASYQDTSFGFKVWASARRAVFTEDAFLHYRQDNEASSVNSPGKVFCVADEYHEIEAFLDKKGLTEELGPMAQATKYGAYIWNFKRLSDELDADFLKLFSKEYKQADRAGILDYGYFDSNMRRDLEEIINHQKLFLTRKHARRNAKVSVLVPVYNTEDYLSDCLDSLLGQTLKDIEIVCVNDGSTDSSLTILESYYNKDPRIVLRDISNRGVAAARNHAVAYASSDFLMFCDSDDTYPASACELLYTAITADRSDLATGEIAISYSSPELAAQYRRTDNAYYRLKYDGVMKLTDTIIKNTDVSLCNKIFRSSLQKRYEIWFPRGMWYEDAKFIDDYMVVSQTATYLRGKTVYQYTRRPGSIMSATAEKSPKALDHVRVAFRSFEFMKHNDLLKGRYKLFVERFTRYYWFSQKHAPSNRHEELQNMVRQFIKNNQRYLNSVDQSIVRDINKLLPHTPPSHKIKRKVKQVIKQPIVKVLSTVSPTYRRQSHIMGMITELDKKVSKLDSQHSRALKDIAEELRNQSIKK